MTNLGIKSEKITVLQGIFFVFIQIWLHTVSVIGSHMELRSTHMDYMCRKIIRAFLFVFFSVVTIAWKTSPVSEECAFRTSAYQRSNDMSNYMLLWLKINYYCPLKIFSPKRSLEKISSKM